MILQNPFRGWQYGVAGLLSGIGTDDGNSLQKPPEVRFTKIGLAVIGSVITIILSVNLALLAKYTVKFWVPFYFKDKIKKILRKEPVLKKYDSEFTVDHLTGIFAEDFLDDMEKRLVEERDLNFRDEYLFYKYYYIVCRYGLKKGYITQMTEGLKEKYEEAHRNYLIMSISGVQND